MQKPETFQVEKLRGSTTEPYKLKISDKDSILYALSIGVSQDPNNEDHLKFTYENDEDFQMFPINPVVYCHLGDTLSDAPGVPQYNPMMLLHGEEQIEIYKKLLPDRTYRVEIKNLDAQYKKGMCIAYLENKVFNDDTNELMVKVLTTYVIRGVKEFKTLPPVVNIKYPEIPQRAPCKVHEETLAPNSALLYRLSGDRNPLHIDQGVATIAGFKKPIIHGLCTYGVTSRVIYDNFMEGKPENFFRFGGKFTSPIYPGQTIIVEMWKDGNTIIYQTKVKDTGKVSLTGYAEIRAPAKL